MGRNFWQRTATAAVASALPGYALLDVVALAAPRQSATAQAPAPVATGPMQLQVRRLGNSVELVVEGAGPRPLLQQSSRGSSWQGQLSTASPTALRVGPQRISLPELGIQSVSLDGSGSSYSLSVIPMPGLPLARPVVSADGLNLILAFPTATQASLQSNRLDLSQPGAVALPTYAPPLQARAVAPPLGDMAVGTMTLRNPGYVNVSGPSVTMTLKNAPAKDALMALAQMGGYGFVFVEDSATLGASSASPTQPRTVSISFRGESYSRALNSTLLAAGLQGKKEGNMIFAGSNVLSKAFGAQLSKVYRLNQVSAGSAADYLANLGASVTKTNTITTSVTQGGDQNQPSGSPNSATTQSSSQTTVEAYGSSIGPLVGLRATTDSRLGTVTLIGDSAVMIIAEQYLRQLDLRQRQVALSVKILDVTLDNDSEIANSFAFRSGNNFIVNAQGRLLGAFGNSLPPTAAQFDQMSGGANSAKPITQTLKEGESNILVPPLTAQPVNPGNVYADDNFFNFVNATITSRSTKVLASPTLILSENQDEIKGGAEVSAALARAGGGGSGSSSSSSGSGLSGTEGGATIGRPRSNESFVTVGEQVITNYTVTNGTQGNGNSCQPSFGIAGLTFGARVSKIDDNGFVTFTLSPQISATTRQQRVEGCGLIDILSIRRLDTGSSRVRDGQTLILTGVISDADSQLVSKWPILGDMPLIGQFFRSTNGGRKKRELVILVTPKILDDNDGGRFGYGYQPSTSQSREFMGASGY